MHVWSDMDTRFYVKELISALDWAHSKGVMHRDMKAANVLINHAERKLKLIDWGLSDFYRYGHPNALGMGTRSTQAPELFLLNPYYDYSLDMWCVLAVFSCFVLN
jgi:casein kinase II subunit alpha